MKTFLLGMGGGVAAMVLMVLAFMFLGLWVAATTNYNRPANASFQRVDRPVSSSEREWEQWKEYNARHGR